MALVKRSELSVPLELAREVIRVEALGGEVAVLELDLGARLEFESALAASRKSGKSLVSAMVPQLLALCVVGDDGEPLFTVKQWQAFGARHRDTAIELFNAAMRLSGFDAEANAKN